MKLVPLTAKGVSTSARIRSARLALLPRKPWFDYQTRVRLRRGFVSLRELGMTVEDAR